MEKRGNNNESRLPILGQLKSALDSVRHRRTMTKEKQLTDRHIAYEALRSNGDFMSMAEVMGETGQSPAEISIALDGLYARNQILKRFSRGDRTIVIARDEVAIPEIGYSAALQKLLIGAGFTNEDFFEVSAAYKAILRDDGGDNSTIPPVFTDNIGQ